MALTCKASSDVVLKGKPVDEAAFGTQKILHGPFVAYE
jgi:hypothetical protein